MGGNVTQNSKNINEQKQRGDTQTLCYTLTFQHTHAHAHTLIHIHANLTLCQISSLQGRCQHPWKLALCVLSTRRIKCD